MNIDQELVLALSAHNFPLRERPKSRRAKDIRAENRNRPNKVRKATKCSPCTLGGHLSNRHNDSGRRRISLLEVDQYLLTESEV